MRYTVIWQPSAEQELADLWMNAEDRNVITEAADQIDDLLRQDAEELGESRTGPIRRMFVPPLAWHLKCGKPTVWFLYYPFGASESENAAERQPILNIQPCDLHQEEPNHDRSFSKKESIGRDQ
jgi:hypothetical protein